MLYLLQPSLSLVWRSSSENPEQPSTSGKTSPLFECSAYQNQESLLKKIKTVEKVDPTTLIISMTIFLRPIYLGRKFSCAELTSSRHVAFSIIAVLISETDSRPVSFFRLSMKVKCLLPWFVVPLAGCDNTTSDASSSGWRTQWPVILKQASLILSNSF